MPLNDRYGPDSVLSVDGVDCGYGRKQVLHGVSFELGSGVTTLLGVNGAGKSTLLRILVGDLDPWRGTLTWLGGVGPSGDLGEVAPRSMRPWTGYLCQEPALPGDMRLEDLVAYAAWLKSMPWREAQPAATRALQLVDLGDRRRDRVRSLSGGMRRRLAIAAAVVHDPKLLVLDEPTASLDPVQCMEVRAVLRALAGTRHILVSTHHLGDVGHLADKVVVLQEGRVEFTGTPAELSALGRRSVIRGGDSDLERGFLSVAQQSRALSTQPPEIIRQAE